MAVVALVGALAALTVLVLDARSDQPLGDSLILGASCEGQDRGEAVSLDGPMRGTIDVRADGTADVRVVGVLTAAASGCAFAVYPPPSDLSRQTLRLNGQPLGEQAYVPVSADLPEGRATRVALTYRTDILAERWRPGRSLVSLTLDWGVPAAIHSRRVSGGSAEVNGVVFSVRLPEGWSAEQSATQTSTLFAKSRQISFGLNGRSFRARYAAEARRGAAGAVVDAAPWVLGAALGLLAGLSWPGRRTLRSAAASRRGDGPGPAA